MCQETWNSDCCVSNIAELYSNPENIRPGVRDSVERRSEERTAKPVGYRYLHCSRQSEIRNGLYKQKIPPGKAGPLYFIII